MTNEIDMDELYRNIVQNDDEKAFEIIFNTLHVPLYNWAFSFVKSKELSEDIIIESFSKLWAGRKTYQIINIVQFMYKSVKNQSLDHINSLRNRSKHLSIDDMEFTLQRYEYSPEYEYIKKEDVDVINGIIDRLPTKERNILYMIREHEQTHKEIAEIMGVSTRTIDRYVNKAITTISKALETENQRVINSGLLTSFLL